MEAPLLATTIRAPAPAADHDGAPPRAVSFDGAPPRPTRAAEAARRALLASLAAGSVFLLALVPRLLDLGQHATADEDLTLIRSANVALALERGDWWGTYQIGHPEATVQLLVALGLGPDALRPYAGDFLGPDGRQAARAPGYFETLVRARQLLAPVHAALVVLAMLLVWRLLGATAGLLAGVLLALEPFLAAHGRILRTDALLAELLLTAVLAALAFWSGRAGPWALALCVLATGLALLTKTPALVLLGAVPASAIAAAHVAWHNRPVAERGPGDDAWGLGSARLWALGRALGWLAVWLAGSLGLAFALWPALWARPLRALERMAVYTQEKGGSPMDAGSFFLGTPIPDPGPLYYAVALPLRLSPLLLAGLLAWAVLRAPGFRRGVGVLLLLGLGLAAVLALLPKKADRYVLPAIPFLAVVAAVGLGALADRWRGLPILAGWRRVLPTAVVVGIVVVGEATLLGWSWPYPLAAYNPLLGGGPTAARTISVGWGEGLDQLAAVLNGQPGAGRLTVSTPYPEVLQAQIAGRAVDLDAYDVAEYVVTYVAASQRELEDPSLDAALADREPLARVEIAGVLYAALYALEPPSFAGGPRVRQLEAGPAIVARRGWVTVRFALDPVAVSGTTGAAGGAAAPAGSTAASGTAHPPGGVVPASDGRSADTAALTYEAEVVLLDAGKLVDVDASIVRPVVADGSVQEVKLRAPSQGGRYAVGLRLRDPRDGRQLGVERWPVGAPRPPDQLVFPSLGVRVQ